MQAEIQCLVEAERHRGACASALLVSMPFYSARTPSVQLGLLAAVGKAHGYHVDTLHLTLDFATLVGSDLYEELCCYRGHELGNWLFAIEAFGNEAPDSGDRFPYDFPNVLSRLRGLGLDTHDLCRIRREIAPEFLNRAEQSIDWAQFKVVGFTSTFQQNTSSVALARRLKLRNPDLTILFGGANLEGAMGCELVRCCPSIDYAIDGEADEAFPAFLDALAEGRDPRLVPGVISRDKPGSDRSPPFTQLDKLPPPNFDEYFKRSNELGVVPIHARTIVDVPFEASRGCWWGRKHHCTFCGQNGSSMSFRQKSPGQVLEELAELARRYGVFRFRAVDNIMPPDFLKEFVTKLSTEQRHYEIFFETKSNLSRPQLKSLKHAGITAIQPGIESLSSRVLQLMRKGVRASQNVNLLRWARHYDIGVAWNMLWGFPGERKEDYDAQAALIPHLVHLQPPTTQGRIWVERFSPYYFDRVHFPVRRLQPEASLAYVYPSRVDLDRLAYFFDHEFDGELHDDVLTPFSNAIDDWQKAWDEETPPWLTYRWSPGILHIEDGRNPATPSLYSFDSPLAEIYTAISDAPTTAAAVHERMQLTWSAEEVSEALDLFATKGLVMRDHCLYLALAIPASSE